MTETPKTCDTCGVEGAFDVQPARSIMQEEIEACRFCRHLPQGPSSRTSSYQLAVLGNILTSVLRSDR